MWDICLTNDKLDVVEQLKTLVPTFHHDREFFDKLQLKAQRTDLPVDEKIEQLEDEEEYVEEKY